MKLTTVLLLLITTIIQTKPSTSINFEPRDYRAGLIFKQISKARVSYESFSIVYHADLMEFFTIKHEIENCLQFLTNLCKHESTDSCNTQMSLLTHKLAFYKLTNKTLIYFNREIQLQLSQH